jgi:predicted amidohydrolase YtcJ
VIPGLIDSHIHLVRAGLTWNDEVHWDGISTLDEALRLLAERATQLQAGSWIRVVGGWHPGQFAEGRGPSIEELDSIAPAHPVYIQLLYEDALLNSAGLRACNITSDTPDPAGGSFERNPASQLPTGKVRGLGAFNFCLHMMGESSLEAQIASTRSMFEDFNRVGLTGAIDTGGFGATPEIYRSLFEVWRQGKMTVRTRLYVGATQAGQEKQQILDWIRPLHPGFGDAFLKFVGVGEIVVFGCHDLEGLHPFTVSQNGPAELFEISRMVAQRGWPMHIHAVLNDTITAVLDAWEQVNREIPLVGRRFSLAHAEPISEYNLLRVQKLDVGIGIQNRLVFRSADSCACWGEEVTHSAPPLQRMLDLGIPLGGGTDATRVSSFNPWLSLWWFITGASVDSAPPRDAAHRLSRAKALQLYTQGSAWFSFEEHTRGTLGPGMLADLAVLSGDYFTVAEEAIPAIEAVLTLVGGRPVYTGSEFADLRE